MNEIARLIGEHPLLGLSAIVILAFIALRIAVRLACLGVVAVAVILIAMTLLGS